MLENSAPLRGKRILVTRPVPQAEKLCRLVAEHGGIPVHLPTLEILPKKNINEIQRTLADLDSYQWIIFTSINAVNFALQANSGKIPLEAPANPSAVESDCRGFVAIGPSTATAMRLAGIPVNLVPKGYTSEALLAMPQFSRVTGQRCLIVRGEGGREQLSLTLRNRGAVVEYLEVYKRTLPNLDQSFIAESLRQHLDWITATSVEALQNLLILAGKENSKRLLLIPLVVVSERIKQAAIMMGFAQIVVADGPADNDILKTLYSFSPHTRK